MSSPDRVAAAEAALVQAALDAGDLTRGQVDAALGAARGRRARGEQVALPQLLAPALRPDQRARLTAVYQAVLAGPLDPGATVLPGAAPALAPRSPRPGALAGQPLPAPLPRPGERVGDVVVERELARGGQGAVFVGKDGANRQVALKVRFGGGAREAARFAIEARATAALDHPSIVRVHAFGTDERGRDYLVLDLVDGESLAQRIARDGPLALPDALGVAKEVARGLAAAHARGVVHRDLKPGNVLLPRTGGARITDFGLARVEDQRERLTRTGQLLGTPCYMPPEQINGRSAEMGPRSDVYAFGALLHAMLVGEPPFDPELPLVALLAAVLRGEVAPPSARRPEIPPALDALVLRCLACEPAGRFADGAALVAALDALEHPPGPSGRSAAIAGALVLGGAAALAAALALRPAPASPPPPPVPPVVEPPLEGLQDDGLAPVISATSTTSLVLDARGRWAARVTVAAARHLTLELVTPDTRRWTLEVRPDEPGASDGPAAFRTGLGEAPFERRLVVRRGAVPPLHPGPCELRIVARGPPGGEATLRVEEERRGAEPDAGLDRAALEVDAAACFAQDDLPAVRFNEEQLAAAYETFPPRAEGEPGLPAVEEGLRSIDGMAARGTPLARVYALAARERAARWATPRAGVADEVARLRASLPDEPAVLWLQAQVELGLGQPDRARGPLLALLAVRPTNRAARLGLARALQGTGDLAAALEHARVVLAHEPREPDASALVGVLEAALTPGPATSTLAVDRLLHASRTASGPGSRPAKLDELDAWLAARSADAPELARVAAERVLAALPARLSDAELAQAWPMPAARAPLAFGRLRVRATALAVGREQALARLAGLQGAGPERARLEELRAWVRQRRP